MYITQTTGWRAERGTMERRKQIIRSRIRTLVSYLVQAATARGVLSGVGMDRCKYSCASEEERRKGGGEPLHEAAYSALISYCFAGSSLGCVGVITVVAVLFLGARSSG